MTQDELRKEWADGYRVGAKERDAEIQLLGEYMDALTNDKVAQTDELVKAEAEIAALRKELGWFRQLRDSQDWPAVFPKKFYPEPLLGEELDAAMQATESTQSEA